MDRIQFGSVFIVLMTIRFTRGSVPGTFFWKPRMAIDLSLRGTDPPEPVRPPTKQNIEDGFVVLIEGYKAGMTVVAIATALDEAKPHPHLDLGRASYYTNMYRWGLRHLSLIPTWLGGSGSYPDTHKVWRRRYFYMDKLVPKWMRVLLPHVEDWDWIEEEEYLRRFNKYAEPAFGKHYRYPSKVFNNFNSEYTEETIENINLSYLSLGRK